MKLDDSQGTEYPEKERKMEKQLWWQGPMRVMQYNLQVADTAGMNAEKIAEETEDLACNVVVMNVGGIYAWYSSEVRYHHVNEFLPKDRDLLKELIDAFHKRNIKFVARFDFSITDDTTYLQKPQWFARHKDKSPYFRGEKRMGNWSLFLNTCANSGYRNEEAAVPILKEVLIRYDIDGIFLNAPMASACFCERCRDKYQAVYGVPMPEEEKDFDPNWLSRCTKDNIRVLHEAIKETKSNVPLILYYIPYSWDFPGAGRIDRDSIYERYATAEMICTESQDILSRGVLGGIPETCNTMLAMKAGQRDDEALKPFGIIHSCPGMDWRHVGLPVAEYLPWMCQVPASGGILWHSVTGYPDTITDKRILKAVGQVDRMIVKSEADMEGAKSEAEAVLLWDGRAASRSWADGLTRNHIAFDLMQDYYINQDHLNQYPLAIVPDGVLKEKGVQEAVEIYVKQGGRVIVENTDSDEASFAHECLGIEPDVRAGEYLTASYLRFEEAGALLKKDMDTDKIAFRGAVSYCSPAQGSLVLATLVPPFAPLEVVGAPPERASIPVEYTDIPLAVKRQNGKGELIYLPFALSSLLQEYKLSDHYQLIGNMVDLLVGKRKLEVQAPTSVQITMYKTDRSYLIHFVNETGERPLRDTIPVQGICASLKVPEGRTVTGVRTVVEDQQLSWRENEGQVDIRLDQVAVWEMIAVDLD